MNTWETRRQDTVAENLKMIRTKSASVDYIEGSIDALVKADEISCSVHTELNLLLRESLERKGD